MRRDPTEYEGRELELIYVAAKLEEAQQLEQILDQEGIDYTIQVEQYRAGVLFQSTRAGAFFYVEPQMAQHCRQLLGNQGWKGLQ